MAKEDLRPRSQWRMPRAVIAIETGERFESVRAAAESVSRDPANIYNSANSDGQYSAGGIHWVYADRQELLVIQPKDVASRHYRRKIINLDTQEVFDSTVLAAKSVNGLSSSIVTAIKRGIRHRGHRWAYYDEDSTND